jgi:transcriptional regulator with XRE-family HTH domain
MNATEFGKRLRQVIDFHGLSASAFAELITVQRSSISHVLSGRNKPSIDFITKLNTALPDVNLYWLLNGAGEMILKPHSSLLTKSDKNYDKSENKLKKDILSKNTSPKKNKSIARIVVFYNDGSFNTYTESEKH